MGRTIKTRGIIVGEAPMGEQDKRLAILCEDKGRLSAIAKGAKKPGARLASQAQLFYYCDMMLEESRHNRLRCREYGLPVLLADGEYRIGPEYFADCFPQAEAAPQTGE